jgi:hypothetical protein
MTKIAESGSISQRHGSEDPDPDPPQNVMDPQHFLICIIITVLVLAGSGAQLDPDVDPDPQHC